MPTYEFRCPDGTIIERFYKISEVPEEIPSPNGDGMAVRIISGGGGLLFKGTGFYITDYGKDGKKDQRAAANSSGGGASSSSSTEASSGSATTSAGTSSGWSASSGSSGSASSATTAGGGAGGGSSSGGSTPSPKSE